MLLHWSFSFWPCWWNSHYIHQEPIPLLLNPCNYRTSFAHSSFNILTLDSSIAWLRTSRIKSETKTYIYVQNLDHTIGFKNCTIFKFNHTYNGKLWGLPCLLQRVSLGDQTAIWRIFVGSCVFFHNNSADYLWIFNWKSPFTSFHFTCHDFKNIRNNFVRNIS